MSKSVAETCNEFIEKAALKCLSLPLGCVSSEGCMFTHVGQNTKFSEMDINWITKVTPQNYCTLMFVGPQTFFTLLVNKEKRRVHVLTIQQAEVIEKATTTFEKRRSTAKNMFNRLVVSNTMLMHCFIPECLYRHLFVTPTKSSSSNSASTNSSSSSSSSSDDQVRGNASDCFTQNSYRMMEALSKEHIRSVSTLELYTRLKSVDGSMKKISDAFNDLGVEAATQMLKELYGMEKTETLLLLFILSHSNMRRQLDIKTMQMISKDKKISLMLPPSSSSSSSSSSSHSSSSSSSSSSASSSSSTTPSLENPDVPQHNFMKVEATNSTPQKFAPIFSSSATTNEHNRGDVKKEQDNSNMQIENNNINQPNTEKKEKNKRRKLAFSNDEKISIYHTYKNSTPEEKKRILQQHNIFSYDINNWYKNLVCKTKESSNITSETVE